MGIAEIMSLRVEYERELIMAQAKVAVVDDIIARFQPEAEAVAEVEETNVDAVEPINLTDDNY